MQIRPLRDQVLVRRVIDDGKTAGGLYIPDTAKKEKAALGFVEAVGPGKVNEHGRFVEVEVKVGQEVVIGRWLGHDVDVEGKKLVLVRAEDILAVVER